MTNIISSQLYKIFHSKMLYVLIAIGCALPLLEVLMLGSLDLSINGTALDLGYDAVSALRNIAVVGSDTNILVIVAVAIIFGKEYSEGTIRNSIMAGNSRTAIFGASAISATVLMLAVALPAFAVQGTACAIAFGFSASLTTSAEIIANIGASLIVYLLANMICVAITLLFVHLTQKVSGSIVFPLLIVLLVTGIGSTVLMVLVMLGEMTLQTMSWIPLAQFFVYTGAFEMGTYVLDWAVVSKIAIMSVALIALLSMLCWYRLDKSNIK